MTSNPSEVEAALPPVDAESATCSGRDPASIGIEVWTSCGSGTPEAWRKEALFWKSAGASHLCLTTTFNRRHHSRIEGHTLADHLGAARRYREAVADAL